jgi:preprotein translocase subunit SecD
MLNLRFLKTFSSIIIVVLAIFYALPNIFGTNFAVQLSANNNQNISPQQIERVQTILEQNNIAYQNIDLQENKIIATFTDNTNQLLAQDILKQNLGRNFIISLNLVSAMPDALSELGGKALSLGLDLRGGVHFLLEVDSKAVFDNLFDNNFNSVRTELRKKRLYKTIKKVDNTIVITAKNPSQNGEIVKIIQDNFENLVRVDENALVFALDENAIKEAKRNAIKQNITTLKNRVNELGVAEPIIQQQGLERIVVQLPGVQDSSRAKEILGSVATIEFRMVDEDGIGKIYYFKDGTPLRLKNRIIAAGDNITGASSGIDNDGNPMVNITLDSAGGKAMLVNTKKNLHKRMAVVFIENKVNTIYQDGKAVKKRTTTKDIINAATIQGTFSTRFQITGLDSAREARNLALLLRAGALSAPIEIIEERTIGPSLGADNINQGLLSIIGGLILVLIFMLVKYRVFGLVADIVLLVNLVVIVAALSLLQATLTLPGIAGIVLTVGMAVDANVLIFERIKEEVINNSLVDAIKLGYEKAFSTIVDANITTLIAAVILFSFGTGPIKGFAVTLSIGIITSIFTAVVLSRILINLIYKK